MYGALKDVLSTELAAIEEAGLYKKERIIKSIPNSYIVFGAIGLLIFSMVKK